MMRLVIRADAGTVPEIGTGHVLRAITLADALHQSVLFQESEICFATREYPPYELGGKLIRQAGYEVITNSGLEPNGPLELDSILSARPDIVIFDRLETDANLVVNLKSAGAYVATLDDLGQGRVHADLAINSLLQNVDPGPKVFVGYDYLFLPSAGIIKSEIRECASTIFVSFGGFDHRQLNAYFLDLIPKIEGPKRYEIIVSGLAADDLDALSGLARRIAATSRVDIVMHQRPENYYQLLGASDLAIVSGGLTAFGCAQAGVPAIGIPQYEHQLENLNRLEAHGCLKLGARSMELDSEILSELIGDLAADYQERLAMNRAGTSLTDGQGLVRTVNLIADNYARHRDRN
jgi:spore coat polysaccharide biosynthesis predicted glycosyltransferase SpsG